MLLFEEKKEI